MTLTLATPTHSAAPRFRACGGEIIDHLGHPITFSEAEAKIALWRSHAEAHIARDDYAAARCWAFPARELARAYMAAHDWRRASGPVTHERIA